MKSLRSDETLRSLSIESIWLLLPSFLGGFLGSSDSKESSSRLETWDQSLGWEDPLEEGLATHSSILAWRIPRTEDSGRLQSIGSQRVDMTEVTEYTHIQPKTSLHSH